MYQAAGPSKKSKPASAPSGKSKKAQDTKETIETELSVSLPVWHIQYIGKWLLFIFEQSVTLLS